jgi:hypothetical protein
MKNCIPVPQAKSMTVVVSSSNGYALRIAWGTLHPVRVGHTRYPARKLTCPPFLPLSVVARTDVHRLSIHANDCGYECEVPLLENGSWRKGVAIWPSRLPQLSFKWC